MAFFPWCVSLCVPFPPEDTLMGLGAYFNLVLSHLSPHLYHIGEDLITKRGHLPRFHMDEHLGGGVLVYPLRAAKCL